MSDQKKPAAVDSTNEFDQFMEASTQESAGNEFDQFMESAPSEADKAKSDAPPEIVADVAHLPSLGTSPVASHASTATPKRKWYQRSEGKPEIPYVDPEKPQPYRSFEDVNSGAPRNALSALAQEGGKQLKDAVDYAEERSQRDGGRAPISVGLIDHGPRHAGEQPTEIDPNPIIHNVVTPLGRAGADQLSGLIEPQTLIPMAAMGGMPGPVQTAASAYFAGDMAKGTYEGAKNTYQRAKEGDIPGAIESGAGTLISAGMAIDSAHGAYEGAKGVAAYPARIHQEATFDLADAATNHILAKMGIDAPDSMEYSQVRRTVEQKMHDYPFRGTQGETGIKDFVEKYFGAKQMQDMSARIRQSSEEVRQTRPAQSEQETQQPVVQPQLQAPTSAVASEAAKDIKSAIQATAQANAADRLANGVASGQPIPQAPQPTPEPTPQPISDAEIQQRSGEFQNPNEAHAALTQEVTERGYHGEHGYVEPGSKSAGKLAQKVVGAQAKAEAKGEDPAASTPVETAPVASSETVPELSQTAPTTYAKGDRVELEDGRIGTVDYAPAADSQLPRYRLTGEDGKTINNVKPNKIRGLASKSETPLYEGEKQTASNNTPPPTAVEAPNATPKKGTTGADFLKDLNAKQGKGLSLQEALLDLHRTYGITESHLSEVLKAKGLDYRGLKDTSVTRNGLVATASDPETGTDFAFKVEDVLEPEAFDKVLAKKRFDYKNPQIQPKLPMTVGSAEASASDTALFQQARQELGADASLSAVAQRAQELKMSQASAEAKVEASKLSPVGKGLLADTIAPDGSGTPQVAAGKVSETPVVGAEAVREGVGDVGAGRGGKGKRESAISRPAAGGNGKAVDRETVLAEAREYPSADNFAYVANRKYGISNAQATKLYNEAVSKPEPRVPEADTSQQAVAPYTPDTFDVFRKSLRSGEVTADQVRASFDATLAHEQAIKTELNKLTVPELRKRSGSMRNDLKKTQLVDDVYDTMLQQHAPGKSLVYQIGGSLSGKMDVKGPKLAAMKKNVAELTDEDIQAYAASTKAHMEGLVKSLQNPETYDEFRKFLQYRGESKLTPEQRIKWDELRAEKNKEQAASDLQRTAVAQGVKADTELSYKEGKHSKTGAILHIVQMKDRVSPEQYKALNSRAKQLGGHYSSFIKADAGFQFKTKEAADKFMQVASGENVSRAEEIQQRKEAVKESAAERLSAVAERLEESANESLNRDRKDNTAKRAREASNAEANAHADLAMAKTLKNLSEAIAEGNAKHLEGIRAKTQVEALDLILRRAVYDRDRKNNVPYEQSKGRPAKLEDIENAEYPYPSLTTSDLMNAVKELSSKPGGKMLAVRLKKLLTPAADQRGYVDFKDVKEIEDFDLMASKVGDKWLKSNIDDRGANYRRMQAAGIADLPTLRAALREYLQYKGAKAITDGVKQMKRDLVGRNFEGFFPTPQPVVTEMLDKADIQPGMTVLEPSAGWGNIADAIRENSPDAELDTLEMQPALRKILEANGHNVVGNDFTEHQGEYDRIVMNPPFENGQDMEHVQRAYDMLKPGGKLVSIMSEGTFSNSNGKFQKFRDWLDSVGGESEKVEEGAFKSSERPTGVNTRMVTIEKPAEKAMAAAATATEEAPYQWKYEEYSPFSRQLAKDYTKAELEKLLGKADGARAGLAASHLRAIERTSSMSSNSNGRASSRNAMTGNYEQRQAYANALEIYEFYPESTKDGAAKTPEAPQFKAGNPFAAKAIAARKMYDRLAEPTARDKAMEQSFPLGGGYGRKGGDKRIDASVNRAVLAEKSRKDAEFYEAKAAAFDRGEINAQGRSISKESLARSDKRDAAQGKRDERIAAAKSAREGKEIWEVPADVYADSTGNLAGSARGLVKYDHEQAVGKAVADGKTVPAEVLKDYPDIKPVASLEPVESQPEVGDIITDGLIRGRVTGEGTIGRGKNETPAYKVEILSGRQRGETSLVAKNDAKVVDSPEVLQVARDLASGQGESEPSSANLSEARDIVRLRPKTAEKPQLVGRWDDNVAPETAGPYHLESWKREVEEFDKKYPTGTARLKATSAEVNRITVVKDNIRQAELAVKKSGLPLTKPEEKVITDPDKNKWAYQKEYFVKALEPVKEAWAEHYSKPRKPQNASAAESRTANQTLTFGDLVKLNSNAHEPPPSFPDEYIRIEIPKDGKFLVKNTPYAINKLLNGADAAFAKPTQGRIPGKNYNANTRSPVEFDNEKYIAQLEKQIADLTDRRKGSSEYSNEELKAARENLKAAKALGIVTRKGKGSAAEQASELASTIDEVVSKVGKDADAITNAIEEMHDESSGESATQEPGENLPEARQEGTAAETKNAAGESTTRVEDIEYRNAGPNVVDAVRRADNLNIPQGSFTVERTNKRDYHFFDRFQTPLSLLDFTGRYEKIGGALGKEASDVIRSAKHSVETLGHEWGMALDKVFEFSERDRKARSLGRRIYDSEFIKLIEKDLDDQTRKGSTPDQQRALEEHDKLTNTFRDYIIQSRRDLGIETPDDWGITTKGYFRHLFLGDIRLFVDGEFTGVAQTYAEAQKKAMEILQDNPDAKITAKAREMHANDPTTRVSSGKYERVVNELQKDIEITREELVEDLKGVIGKNRNKHKFFGALLNRKGVKGYSMDYREVMELHAAQVARTQELSKLNRALQPIIEKVAKGGQPGLADAMQRHLDTLWGIPSKAEQDFGRMIESIPVLRNHVANPALAMRSIAARLTGAQSILKLRFNIKSALVNGLDPQRTLWPYTTTREFAGLYADWLKPETRQRLRDLGVVQGTTKLEGDTHVIGHSAKDPFGYMSQVNRSLGYLHGEKEAIKLGLIGDEVHRHAMDWADKVEFDNSAWNAPEILRTPAGRIFGQFKGYSIKTYENLLQGVLHKRAGESWREPSARFGKWIGGQTVVGGVKATGMVAKYALRGVLLVGALTAALKHFGMDDKSARKTAEAIYYGAPSIIGLDLSASAGILDAPFGQTTWEKVGSTALGPTVGTAVGMLDKVSNADEPSDMWNMARSITPYAKSAEAFFEMATHKGHATAKVGKNNRIRLNPFESTMLGLGFTPVKQSRYYDQKDAAKEQRSKPWLFSPRYYKK